ncbi:translation initiation factor IF-3 [bacterium]|nr:translation initiation factor IF-3 [bacterium]
MFLKQNKKFYFIFKIKNIPKKRKKKLKIPFYRINNSIRAPELRLIDNNGKHLGIVSREEALKQAQEKNLDLVEISPKADPPVVKIINFGDFKYHLRKQQQKQKAKEKHSEIKGIRLSLRIGKHDKELKINQAKKFLEQGHKIKVEMILKGREKAHFDLAKNIINKFIQDLEKDIIIEQPITRQEGKLTTLIREKT